MDFNTLHNISLFAASLNYFGNLFHSLKGADAQKDLTPYIDVFLFGATKSEEVSDCTSFTGIYFWIRALRYSDAVPLSSLNV